MMRDATTEPTTSSPSQTNREQEIRVIVVDDQPVARLGTRQLLDAEDDIRVISQAANRTEALRETERCRPDVLVTEMVLPGTLGTDVVAAVDDARLQVPVLILSAYSRREYLTAFLNSRAAGYLLKSEEPAAIVEAVRGVHAGRRGWFSQRIASRLLTLQRPDLNGNGRSKLTGRESELLSILARGCSNREIAVELHLTVGTVKNYLTEIYKKLDVNGREKAIVWAHQHLLVDM